MIQMMSVIEGMDLPIDSVVVVRHNQLVFEAYPIHVYKIIPNVHCIQGGRHVYSDTL